MLHFLKQHLTAFYIIFNEISLPYRVPNFRGQKVVKHCGHQGILFLLIEQGPICNSMAASL